MTHEEQIGLISEFIKTPVSKVMDREYPVTFREVKIFLAEQEARIKREWMPRIDYAKAFEMVRNELICFGGNYIYDPRQERVDEYAKTIVASLGIEEEK